MIENEVKCNSSTTSSKPIKKSPYKKNIKEGSQLLRNLMKQVYAERAQCKDLSEFSEKEEKLSRKICGLKDGYGVNKVLIMILHNMAKYMKKSRRKLYEKLWELKILIPQTKENLYLLFKKRKRIPRRHSIDGSGISKSKKDNNANIGPECKEISTKDSNTKIILLPPFNVCDKYSVFLERLCELYAELCEFTGNLESIFINVLKSSTFGKYLKCGSIHKSMFYQEILKDQIIAVIEINRKNILLKIENNPKYKEWIIR